MTLSNEQLLKENLLEILDHKIFVEKKNENNKHKILFTMNYSKKIIDLLADNNIQEINSESDEEEENYLVMED